MKYSFIPLLAATVVILTSLSECNTEVDSPVSAKINGVLYSSPDHEDVSTYSWAQYTGKTFLMAREIYSESGNRLHIKFMVEDDTLLMHHKYTDASIHLGGFGPECVSGWIEFLGLSNGKHRNIYGIFEFEVRDPDSGQILYDVNEGFFSVAYKSKP